MTLTPEFTQHATTEEAYAAIQRLQESDFRKLMIIARSFTRKRRLNGAIAEPDDLLQEAFVKTLAGQRRWSRDVGIIRHLDRVMESDSGHVVEQRVREARGDLELRKHPDVRPETAAPRAPSPEALLQACEALDSVLAHFAEDTKGLEVLRLSRWSRDVGIIRHLDRVMESDSGHVVEQRVREARGDLELRKHPDVRPRLPPEHQALKLSFRPAKHLTAYSPTSLKTRKVSKSSVSGVTVFQRPRSNASSA